MQSSINSLILLVSAWLSLAYGRHDLDGPNHFVQVEVILKSGSATFGYLSAESVNAVKVVPVTDGKNPSICNIKWTKFLPSGAVAQAHTLSVGYKILNKLSIATDPKGTVPVNAVVFGENGKPDMTDLTWSADQAYVYTAKKGEQPITFYYCAGQGDLLMTANSGAACQEVWLSIVETHT